MWLSGGSMQTQRRIKRNLIYLNHDGYSLHLHIYGLFILDQLNIRQLINIPDLRKIKSIINY
jgi:hypothetical protein